jgi:sugar lactone lactonase YvrE
LVTDQYNPIYLAVNATNLYWANRGNLMTTLLSGGSVDTLYSGGTVSEGIAVDAKYVYWSTYTANTIMRMPLGGGTAETLVTTTPRPLGVAVDSTTLYFTTSDGSVMTVPIGGGTPKTLIAGPPGGFATGIAVTPTNVFWGTFTQLLEAPLSGGGTQTVLSDKQQNVFGVAVDGSDVYFTNEYGGTLTKMSLPSGIAVALVSGYSTYAGGVAVDASSIYWAAMQADNQGSIMRLAK